MPLEQLHDAGPIQVVRVEVQGRVVDRFGQIVQFGAGPGGRPTERGIEIRLPGTSARVRGGSGGRSRITRIPRARAPVTSVSNSAR